MSIILGGASRSQLQNIASAIRRLTDSAVKLRESGQISESMLTLLDDIIDLIAVLNLAVINLVNDNVAKGQGIILPHGQ